MVVLLIALLQTTVIIIHAIFDTTINCYLVARTVATQKITTALTLIQVVAA